MHLIQAVPVLRCEVAVLSLPTLWVLQPLKEPQHALGFQSNCHQAGQGYSPPPTANALGPQQREAGEQADVATWGIVQNSR